MITTARRQYPKPVSALPPRRSRCGDFAFCQARLHRVRAGQDVASAGCFRHPRRHDGLRQDGRRQGRPYHRLHDRARQLPRSVLPPGMVRHEADHPDHLRRHERVASARLLREPRPRQRDQHRRRRLLRPHRLPGSRCDLAASGLRVLEVRCRPDPVRERAQGICPRVRVLPERCGQDVSGLARKAGRTQVSQ